MIACHAESRLIRRGIGAWLGIALSLASPLQDQTWADPSDPASEGKVANGEPIVRVADASNDARSAQRREPNLTPARTNDDSPGASDLEARDRIAQAKRLIAECQRRYRDVKDYTCTFYKRERVKGQLTPQYVMAMKARSQPSSVYFKFHRPYAGREAIWVAGRNEGKVVVHDVGINKFLAGTMHLDPKGGRAMEDNRHPITEAGIGKLIDSVAYHWERELDPRDSQIVIRTGYRVGDRPCTVIESSHPTRAPHQMFHLVKLYIDQEIGLPIRFEAYDWPKHPGQSAELLEEYVYANLRVNVGLAEGDFDPNNHQYSFGRF